MSAPFSSDLAADLAPDVLERFQRYVRIDTQAARDRTKSPSTDGQLDLARLLVADLERAGLTDVTLDANGYVTATLPGAGVNGDGAGRPIGLIAHMDTSPDAPGAGVEPIVHADYDGGVIELPRQSTRLDPAAMPELAAKHGHDIVTSSGDTLLGADDKAGVAEIVAAVAYLRRHPEIPHGPVKVAFNPDEEIGRGVTHFPVDSFGVVAAYTVDGSTAGEIQSETFSGAQVRMQIRGRAIHPGWAKGELVNAIKLASAIIEKLPKDARSPETTEEREGYVHPVLVNGNSSEVELRFIVRDFENDLLDEHVAFLRAIAGEVAVADPRCRIDVESRVQYRNMRDTLDKHPEIVDHLEEAVRRVGLKPRRTAIRGGTDGSALTEMGLPTPNIFTGGHDAHSEREWICIEDMGLAAATVVELAKRWAEV
jgi:tripeptide aminopeptidase